MRLWHIFKKTLLEQLRSGWDLVISVSLAPLFLLLYWIFVGTASTATYPVLALDLDQPDCSQGVCVQKAVQRLEAITYGTSIPVLRVQMVTDQASGEARLRNREAVAMVTFPKGYATGLEQARQPGGGMPAAVQLTGDLSHPYYPLVGVIISSTLGTYADEVTGRINPLVITEKALGNSGERSEFDLYVPGLLIASIVMILFSVSITIAREVESGTARRLVLTSMTSFDYLGGISLVYLLISLVSVLVTFGLAVGLGFHYYGSITLAIIICLLTAMGSIAAGILTACFSKTMSRAAVIANIPLLLLLFLSGAIFPLPYPVLFSLEGHPFTLADILPTTHAVNALNIVLGLGAGLGEVWVELVMLTLLTAFYFYAGVRLFKQLQMK